jgi:hypothetical protein
VSKLDELGKTVKLAAALKGAMDSNFALSKRIEELKYGLKLSADHTHAIEDRIIKLEAELKPLRELREMVLEIKTGPQKEGRHPTAEEFESIVAKARESEPK